MTTRSRRGCMGSGSSMDEWAAAVLEQVEGSFLACGASMGGYCALAIARRAPERLTGLVLAGARVEADSPERRAGRADTIELIRSQRPFGAVGGHAAEALLRDGLAGGGRARARPSRSSRAPTISCGRWRRSATATTRPRSSPRSDVPLVMAVGEHDPFISVEEARATGGRLRVFEGCRTPARAWSGRTSSTGCWTSSCERDRLRGAGEAARRR